MKKAVKKFVILLMALLNIISDTGCWNYRELNDIAILSGVAMDQNKETNEYAVTLEIVNTRGGEEQKNVPDVITMEGSSIFDAVRGSIVKLGRRIYWSHAKVVIISRDIAERGIVPVLDFLYRDAEIRSSIWILISDDEMAKETLMGQDNYHDTISYHIDEAFRSDANVSKYVTTELWKLVDDLSREGISTTIPIAKMIQKDDERVPMIVGTAVFKKDRMVGTLDLNETRNMLLAAGKYEKGVIAIPDVTANVSEVSLEIIKCKTKSKSVLRNGLPGVKVDIVLDVIIGEIMGTENLIDEKGREKVKKKAQEVLTNQVQDVIKRAQSEYKSDIFGFGGTVQRQMPDLWKKIEPEWVDIFSEMDTEVNVVVNIRGSALNSKSLKIGD